MIDANSREALRGEEVAIVDLLAKKMTAEQWAAWLKAPLELAVAQGDARLSQEMIAAGAEVGNALHEAVRGRHEDIMFNLLDHAAETAVNAKDEDDYTPLHVALQSAAGSPSGPTNTWCETVVRLLLRKGADPNAMGPSGTPLHCACIFHHLGAAKELLEAGADWSLRLPVNDDPRSVLDLAAGTNTADMVRLLLEHGADVTAADQHGYTPLHHAGYSHFAEVADVLIEAGASVGVLNGHNATPLHVAAGRLNPTMVRAFLNHGANVNARCELAVTPLHQAAMTATCEPRHRRMAADVVDLLLRSGAEETLVDDDDCTALDLANEELEDSTEHEDVVERMRELLANAPADKAWRRRGYWALCRAHPDRLELEDLLRSDNTRTDGSKKRRRRTRSSPRASSVRAEVDLQRNGGCWADAAVWVLGLAEDAIFRTIVGYL